MTKSSSSVYVPQWGDRVDHRLFGLGTVNGEPVATEGPTKDGRGIEDKGWRVPVKWDDEARAQGSIASHALRLVDRPNAKGGAFWHAEYLKLVTTSAEASKGVEAAIRSAYRPFEGEGLQRLQIALKAEGRARAALVEFLEADERGEHA